MDNALSFPGASLFPPAQVGSHFGIHPDDSFIILASVIKGTIPQPVASNESLKGAQRTVELGIEAGRWEMALIVERVCRYTKPEPQPAFIVDFFDKD